MEVSPNGQIVRDHGNSEVVDLAKAILAEAEKGKLVYLVFAAAHALEDKICFSHAGVYSAVPSILVGLDLLSNELKEQKRQRESGPAAVGCSANYVEYNLATDPLCFDFAHWLIDSEMIRRRMGAPAPLRVGFRHLDELTDKGKRWLNNVLRPMLPMIGAVEADAALGGWRKALFVPTEIVAASKRGEKVPLFKPPPSSVEQVGNWLSGRNPVTITLREAPYWEHRNSNMEAWLKLAGDLKAKGEDVVFVRDTAKGNEPIEGFHTYPQAAYRLDLRLALYEQSKINMLVSNGPGALLIWGSRPYLYVHPLQDHEVYYAARPDWFQQAMGIGWGEQWPWALPGQRMVYGPDNYETLCEAWEARNECQNSPAQVATGSNPLNSLGLTDPILSKTSATPLMQKLAQSSSLTPAT